MSQSKTIFANVSAQRIVEAALANPRQTPEAFEELKTRRTDHATAQMFVIAAAQPRHLPALVEYFTERRNTVADRYMGYLVASPEAKGIPQSIQAQRTKRASDLKAHELGIARSFQRAGGYTTVRNRMIPNIVGETRIEQAMKAIPVMPQPGDSESRWRTYWDACNVAARRVYEAGRDFPDLAIKAWEKLREVDHQPYHSKTAMLARRYPGVAKRELETPGSHLACYHSYYLVKQYPELAKTAITGLLSRTNTDLDPNQTKAAEHEIARICFHMKNVHGKDLDVVKILQDAGRDPYWAIGSVPINDNYEDFLYAFELLRGLGDDKAAQAIADMSHYYTFIPAIMALQSMKGVKKRDEHMRELGKGHKEKGLLYSLSLVEMTRRKTGLHLRLDDEGRERLVEAAKIVPQLRRDAIACLKKPDPANVRFIGEIAMVDHGNPDVDKAGVIAAAIDTLAFMRKHSHHFADVEGAVEMMDRLTNPEFLGQAIRQISRTQDWWSASALYKATRAADKARFFEDPNAISKRLNAAELQARKPAGAAEFVASAE